MNIPVTWAEGQKVCNGVLIQVIVTRWMPDNQQPFLTYDFVQGVVLEGAQFKQVPLSDLRRSG